MQTGDRENQIIVCGEGPGQARSELLGEAVCKNGVLGTGIVTLSKDWRN